LLFDLLLRPFLPEKGLLVPNPHAHDAGAADAAPDRTKLHPARGGGSAYQLFQLQVLVKLQTLPGQQKNGALGDVQDGITDPLEALGNEEVGDDVRRIVTGLGPTLKRLSEGIAIVPVELGLAPGGRFGLLHARLGKSVDDLAKGGERNPGWS